jgi:glyceraldehyde 3-phosphate dehydrogenase
LGNPLGVKDHSARLEREVLYAPWDNPLKTIKIFPSESFIRSSTLLPLVKPLAIRVGINGFGRIGRILFRAILEGDYDIEVAAVNDLTDAKTLAHLLRYDSIHGRLNREVSFEEDHIIVGERTIKVLSQPEPSKLPWSELGVHTVVEATGRFTRREDAAKHLEAGAIRVLVTAPSKGADATIVPGVNHEAYDPERHRIVSLASCTTNCLAPMVKVLHDNFGVERGFMTTIHAYTNNQRLLDMQHRDLRRARAAAVNIVPTTTGAARAIGLVLPELDGRLNGMAMRVPVSNVSITDLVATLGKEASAEEVNEAYREAAEGSLKGILAYTEEPLVSSDFIHDPHSVVVDGLSTMAIGNLVKVVGWYDNEWGYCNRLAWMLEYMSRLEGL